MIEIKTITMPRADFIQLREQLQLRLIDVKHEMTTDNGGNTIFANVEYYIAPSGELFKYPAHSVPIKDPKYRRDCLEDDIDRLRTNVRNLLKAIYEEKGEFEINRNVLKIKHPVSIIQKRIEKDEHDEKMITTACVKITSDIFAEQLALISSNTNIQETFFITQIFSTEEIQRGGHDILITALMQLQSRYTDDENENA